MISDESVRVNRETISTKELPGVLVPMLSKRTDRRVVIECGDHVRHGVFVEVLDQVKLCGAGEIAVLGR